MRRTCAHNVHVQCVFVWHVRKQLILIRPDTHSHVVLTILTTYMYKLESEPKNLRDLKTLGPLE